MDGATRLQTLFYIFLSNARPGAYCGFPTGDIDDLYDQEMIDIGSDRFEKMVSGGYQGGLMTKILQTAALARANARVAAELSPKQSPALAGISAPLPAFITAEGSTFDKQKDFRQMLETFLEEFAARKHGFSYELHTVSDAVTKGIAIACLS